MSQYALRLPDSLFAAAKQLAKTEHTSLNQLFSIAIAEKISALQTETLLEQRAAQADAVALQTVLHKVKRNNNPVLHEQDVPT